MQTQLKWCSLCAPLDIVSLLPLFFLYFWAVVVFFGFFDFFFFFFDIFSSLRSTKEVTTENMSLVAGLFTFQVSEVSSDANNRNMIRNKAKISTRKHNSDDAVYVLL